MNALLLLMGGAGERFGGKRPKQFLDIEHEGVRKPLFEVTAQKLMRGLPLDVLIFVLPKDIAGHAVADPAIRRLSTEFPDRKMKFIAGGLTRFSSFLNGLAAVRQTSGVERVLIHDANRPYLNEDFLARVGSHLGYLSKDLPAFIPVTPVVDSVVRVDGTNVLNYENRNELRRVQTPQLLHLETFYAAYELAMTRGQLSYDFTDEGSFCLSLGLKVGTFEGDVGNTKITFFSDLIPEKL